MNAQRVLYRAAFLKAARDLAEKERSGTAQALLSGVSAAAGGAAGAFGANLYMGKKLQQAVAEKAKAFKSMSFLKKLRYIIGIARGKP